MSVEVLDSTMEVNPFLLGDDDVEDTLQHESNIDARRRVEDKLEELRLRRETQEFDFDV